ncbi:ABC transporter substrate-binding protein [Lacrimispora sphenoides]|uniref:Sn-glycerol 3-phosphate transport system substrate-binding protein n=1 Tax=Lacrimispora sphenoides JCM 1415 TaxID=1297793 RepID=A0ABY1CAZ5_9FIRM|nr:sn-glycerol 3-phosphate transport system substrate-binding protein [[Clostridium] sphenoides JCM 1415]SUY51937.1 extracellular solute-binding protein [Lacrimispora sphenoides]
MKKMKYLSAITLAMVMAAAGVLTGCGGNSTGAAKAEQTETNAESDSADTDSAKAETQENAGDALRLTFYYPVNVGGSAAQLIEKICTDFNSENPDIVVEPVYTGNYDDTVTKIQTAVQGGTPPDVFVSLATQRFTMSSTGMAMPLDDFIAADGEEGKAFISDFLPGFMEDSYVDGKIYSIPFQRSTEILYYNKDLFKEAGLDPEKPPRTWEELADYGVKLTNSDHYGVGIALNSGSAQWTFTGFALQNSKDGKNLMSEDGKTVYFNTPENVEALQFWLDLQNKYKCMAEGIVQWTDLPTQFLAGEVAMIYHTTGNMANINSNAKFEFGTAFMPGHARDAAPTGGGNFYISNGIAKERADAAWKFIKFATSTERAAQWSLDTGYVATRQSCYETDLIKDYYAKVPQASIAYEQLPYAKPELTTYNAAEIWRILNDNIQAAVVGDMTAQEALDQAQEEAEEVLADFQ